MCPGSRAAFCLSSVCRPSPPVSWTPAPPPSPRPLPCVLLSSPGSFPPARRRAARPPSSSPVAPDASWPAPRLDPLWIRSTPASCSAAPFPYPCSCFHLLTSHSCQGHSSLDPAKSGHFSVFLCCPLNLPAPSAPKRLIAPFGAFLARPPTRCPGLLLASLAVPSPSTLGPSLDPFSLCRLSHQP